MVRPIPRKVLIHTIDYKHLVGNNGWDDEFDDPVKIIRVRVVPTSRIHRTMQSEGREATHRVFIDRQYSEPFLEPSEGSRVTWQGKEFTVGKVSAHYDFSETPHHYEVELW